MADAVKSKEAKPVAEDTYKREMKYDEKTKTWKMDNQDYVEIPKSFSDQLVKQMKNGTFYESIIVFNGVDYMQKSKYEAYQALAKSLSRNK